MREFSQFVTTWEDAAELGRTFRQAGDEARFELGDLVCFVCVRREGRPLTGADDKTLTEFAREIGEHRPVLSQLASMSEFLSDELERQTCFEMGVGWHSLNAARIRTGWKPGEPVIKKQRDLFWQILTKEADGGDAKLSKRSPVMRLKDELTQLQKRMGEIGMRDNLPMVVYSGLATAQDSLQPALDVLQIILDADGEKVAA